MPSRAPQPHSLASCATSTRPRPDSPSASVHRTGVASEPSSFDVVLNEAVLRRPIGGDAGMVSQLERLREASELPNVTIKVVPFSAGLHLGVLTGAFGILRFPLNGDGSESEPPTVYADGFTGALYLDKPHEVERYDNVFRNLQQTALDDQASRRLISEVAGSYGQG
ncbi:DUF5753 domain-containing protein [Kitasatospora sp. GP30]|uniref:DUF5753 domain-containing protein n=1 Tax=Kitasatospora sp. GP30 TaxID=3035084 RepID=UPI002477246A|nr:DUF5753 domain-containing protein [Kitasatospora sp. GP30]